MRILIVCYERILPAGCTFNSFLRSSSVPLNHVINTFMQYTPFQSLHLVYIAKAAKYIILTAGFPRFQLFLDRVPGSRLLSLFPTDCSFWGGITTNW